MGKEDGSLPSKEVEGMSWDPDVTPNREADRRQSVRRIQTYFILERCLEKRRREEKVSLHLQVRRPFLPLPLVPPLPKNPDHSSLFFSFRTSRFNQDVRVRRRHRRNILTDEVMRRVQKVQHDG